MKYNAYSDKNQEPCKNPILYLFNSYQDDLFYLRKALFLLFEKLAETAIQDFTLKHNLLYM